MGNGDSYVVLEAPQEILGGNFLVAIINDRKALRSALLSLKSRQQAEFWDHYRQQGLTEWFPGARPYAVRLLEEAYPVERRRRGRPIWLLREKIWKNWGRPKTPRTWSRSPAGHRPRRTSAASWSTPANWPLDPLFHTWMPGLDELTPWVEKFQEIEESPLVLSDQQKQARGDALVDEATRALYPPETRPCGAAAADHGLLPGPERPGGGRPVGPGRGG